MTRLQDIYNNLGCNLIQIPSGKNVKGNCNLGIINNYHGQLKAV